MYKIEAGIEIPASQKEKRKYPFDEMKIGESFYAEGVNASVRVSAHKYSKNNTEKKFITRRVNNGIRCWRVK